MSVLFATNRTYDAQNGFTKTRSDVLLYGSAHATPEGAMLEGAVDAAWLDEDIEQLINNKLPNLVFIHGFYYAWSDVIAEAEQIGALLANAGVEVNMIVFDWASHDEEIGFPNIVGPYFDDKQRATDSAPQFVAFLNEIATIKANMLWAAPSTPLSLLAHSMGNYALSCALRTGAKFPANVFDQAILAAADVAYDDLFLLKLGVLAKHVLAMTSRTDEALALSSVLNGVKRLGQNGPKNPIDGLGLAEFTHDDPLSLDVDATHQYFKTDPTAVWLITQLIGLPAQ